MQIDSDKSIENHEPGVRRFLSSFFLGLVRAARSLLAISGILIISACTSVRHHEYAPFVRDLDGLSEIAISTYPAGFPKRLSKKGDVFKKYVANSKLYFQIHIRDKGSESGPASHVQTIDIHKFSYRIADDPPVTLLSGYQHSFWMQNNPRYEQRDLPAVPYVPGGKVSIEISFTMNGKTFQFEGDMPANEKSRVYLTSIVHRGV
ncbi:MAG: hypothetical protein AAF004_00885 [Pseudomonadota bacterium]